MNARAFLVGAVRVEVAAPLAEGTAGELLAGFPEAPAGPAGLAIVPAAAGEADPKAAGTPSFFHGTLRAVVNGSGFLLRDGETSVAVSADGRRLELSGPTSAADGCSELALLVGVVLALRHHGLFHLHAAALQGDEGRGVLIAGTSGAGKTTLALALAAAGLRPLADDAVLAMHRGGSPAVVGFPRAFHLGERTAAAFPALAGRLGPPSHAGKRPLDPRALVGARRGATVTPDVILLPVVDSADRTASERLAPAAALGALLEGAALLAADGMPAVAEHLAVLRSLADAARTVRVRLGRDLLDDPGAVARSLLTSVDQRS